LDENALNGEWKATDRADDAGRPDPGGSAMRTWLTGMICMVAWTVFAAPASNVLLHDDFNSGLKGWKQEGSGISLMTADNGERYVRIIRQHRRTSSFIQKEFRSVQGNLMVKCRLKGEGIQSGLKAYQRGKVQAIVRAGREAPVYISEEFDGDVEWVTKEIAVPDLQKGDKVTLRIGLENASGTLLIDDVEITCTDG